MIDKKILTSVPYLSSVLHLSYTKSYELVEGLKTIPQKWIEDLKHVEYNELLSSSIGPLALYFGWKRRHKEEFAEIASGVLASSTVHGDPVGTVTAIVLLAYRYTKSKNKAELRNLKWGLIKGSVSVGVFAITTKAMGASLISFLVAICIATAIRKTVGVLRLFEYAKFLRSLRAKLPKLKRHMSRREFLSLRVFTYKNA
jgi:hypothetical protein|tara:strand:+ start:1342 stop:1941 length:600 start_codon:yes stop_codon:yes gene_type:complete